MTKIVMGIDIASTKVAVVVAEIEEGSSDIKILTMGCQASQGITKGLVDNIEKASRSAKDSYHKISEYIVNQDYEIFVNISGSHIRSLNSKGLETMKVYREVTDRDVERAIDRAKGIALPEDREILDYIPQYFSLDENVQVKDPIGMTGVRLETLVHIITAKRTAMQNIFKVLEFLPCTVQRPVLSSLASSFAVLEKGEKELGVALVDIGGGTTDVSVFIEGSVRHTCIIPVAGNHITKDIAIGIKTSFEEAEEIKIKYGYCLNKEGSEHREISVSGLGDQQKRIVTEQTLIDIVEPRIREIFIMIASELEKQQLLRRLGAGIVFTGGGSLVTGTTDYAKRFFNDLPVRTGRSSLLEAFKSSEREAVVYSTAIGLLKYGCLKGESEFMTRVSKKKKNKSTNKGLFKGLKDVFKNIM